MPRHFLSISDLGKDIAKTIVLMALDMKRTNYRGDALKGRNVAMVFEKASTRTRVSFDVAIRHLGGQTIFMTPAESQLGRNEPLKDTARVLSRYTDCMVVRTFGQEKLEELARFSSVPVVNALTDRYHPCQVMSDMLTIFERNENLEDVRVAWVGDGNNMANSWLNAAAYFPFSLAMATPEGYDPDPEVVETAKAAGAKLTICRDPKQAVKGAHFVNTDVWASMGQEDEAERRGWVFAPYQVNDELLALADPDVKVMHCLPAHRGEEITEQVMESDRAIVWDQAENRLHMQKALLAWLFS
ncbi:MAG: ornithine carbamoyltransferase [Desulfovibrio sp.]|nr:MAG: ornithine carbamoyltransferase [Desulfovibrio sp.]